MATNTPKNRIAHWKKEVDQTKKEVADLALELSALENRRSIIASQISDKHHYITMRSQWIRQEEMDVVDRSQPAQERLTVNVESILKELAKAYPKKPVSKKAAKKPVKRSKMKKR